MYGCGYSPMSWKGCINCRAIAPFMWAA
jgi:hypothetical protein